MLNLQTLILSLCNVIFLGEGFLLCEVFFVQMSFFRSAFVIGFFSFFRFSPLLSLSFVSKPIKIYRNYKLRLFQPEFSIFQVLDSIQFSDTYLIYSYSKIKPPRNTNLFCSNGCFLCLTGDQCSQLHVHSITGSLQSGAITRVLPGIHSLPILGNICLL